MSIIDKYREKASEIEYDFIQNDRTYKDVLDAVTIDLFDELEKELEKCVHPFKEVVSGNDGMFCTKCQEYITKF